MGLEYYSPKLKEGQFRVSPSSLSVFFDNSWRWYQQNILKQNTFKGNKNSVLGTLLHNRIENFYNGKPIDKQEEKEYLDSYKDNPEVDEWYIQDNLEPMYEAWKKTNYSFIQPVDVEPYYQFEPRDDIVIGGSIDMVFEENGKTILVDWKSCSRKPSSIGAYRLQLLTYCWICKQLGKKIDAIRVVYIQTPTKTLPSRVHEFEIEFTDDELEYIESQLKVVVRSLTMAREDEELIPILFRNNPSSRFS